MNIIELLTELVQIPAPSGKEAKRAEYICKYLKKCGLNPLVDSVGNVIIDYTVGQGGYTVFMAHMDTVFADEKITVVRTDNILSAPGIGDDTANVVLLMKTLEDIAERKLKPLQNVLAVFNVCEEGMGNLKGVRQLMQDYSGRVKEVISFDLGYETICMKAVGSKRYRVTVKSPGGHSFHAFGQKGAIEAAAEMIRRIYCIPIENKENTKTTYNIGTISGGTSVNTIAQECTFLAEVRSDDTKSMADTERKMLEAFQMFDHTAEGIKVVYELVGDRPTDSNVPKQEQKALMEKAAALIQKYIGIKPDFKSGSTDCNIPLSMGIPAVSFGGYRGGGAHTRQEWIDSSFMDTGYELIREFVESYFV